MTLAGGQGGAEVGTVGIDLADGEARLEPDRGSSPSCRCGRGSSWAHPPRPAFFA